MKFTLNRTRTLASLVGVSIEFVKDVPTHVPPEMYAEVMAAGATPVEEITDELVAVGHLKYYDRNFVAPRLTELKGAGVLEVVGKKPSKRTGKNTAVWAAVRR